MRFEFIQSIDFNQMLVYSTFVHLVFFTFVMFLPDPRGQEQIVVPTFRLDLIKLPKSVKSGLEPNKKSLKPIKKKAVPKKPIKKKTVSKKPIKKKTVSKKPIKKKTVSKKPITENIKIKNKKIKPLIKKSSPSKPLIRESKARKKILADLGSFESSQSKKSVLKELDQLTRLVPEVKSMEEESFVEVEKKNVLKYPLVPKPLPSIEKFEVKQEELEAKLSKKPVKINLDEKTQTTSRLIKELEAMENKKAYPSDKFLDKMQLEKFDSPLDNFSDKMQLEKFDSPSAFNNIKGESLTTVVKKFERLKVSSEEIKIDISQGRMVVKEFKTTIQKGEVPVPKTDSKLETSNALSHYVGQVYKRVYSNWKTPFGVKFKDVVVSFSIFPKGNISNPVIRESTGDKTLDAIAVSAILSSVPFPTLPDELLRPNLKISIVFKYVPESE